MAMDGWIRRSGRSWHALRTWTRVPRRVVARCGRTVEVDGEAPTIPPNEKSCESCLRLTLHDQEQGENAEVVE